MRAWYAWAGAVRERGTCEVVEPETIVARIAELEAEVSDFDERIGVVRDDLAKAEAERDEALAKYAEHRALYVELGKFVERRRRELSAEVARLREECNGSRALLNQAMDYFAGHGESTWARTLKDNIRGWLAERADLADAEEGM